MQPKQVSIMPTIQQENNKIFSSALDNLALAAFSYKDVIAHIIVSDKTLEDSNKTLTATI